MNPKTDVTELIIKNILNYLKKKKIDYKDFLRELYKLVPQEKVDYFFAEKQGVDGDLIIGISKVLKENLNYFCIPHIEDESLSIKQEKLVELAKLCNQNFDVKSVKATYYQNCSVSEIMEL